ncbi:MAG: flagellar hook-associated protein 3 [Ferrovum sp.]|jgi:flagellar hook-associated protein 3 FlgL|uniref:flagellar hook-associated protein FlgL n=1 Tax=Ferrovum sp. TaxID=2609467 RepID=UPI002622BD0B|nr:flagellar hook-associated protein FlgL [Ferrovum sp.]MBW8066460.1 flagellar hook-associated protein 3 [Ferrovum sp.]
MVRISTNTYYDTSIQTMNQQQSALLNTQLQLSSGKRINTPADNPAGAAQVIDLTQAAGMNTQYQNNITAAQSQMSMASSVLQSITTLVQNVQSTAISANNASLNDSNRQTLATTLQQQLTQLIGLANSQDGTGNYLFSGTKGSTKPFVVTSSGVQYQGNSGQQQMQVSNGRSMPTNVNGADLFMNIPNGNGYFVTSNSSSNAGSGAISQGGLASPPPTPTQQGNHYTLTFSITGGVTTYTVSGTDASGAPLSSGSLPSPNQPYTSGQTISFNGIQFNIQGQPANGDSFNIAPSTHVPIFQTIQNLINLLNTPLPAGNATAASNFTQQLQTAEGNLNQGLNAILTGNVTLGTNLSTLTNLTATENSLNIQYQSTISQIQDTNYTSALSLLSQEKLSLQAAMQSFTSISSLSLFNYLR